MAIVKGAALSLQASGNLGDICYSTWRGQQIARSTWTGTVPNTVKQVTQQGFLSITAQYWGGTLTGIQREKWTRRARTVVWKNRFGDDYIPSGYQLFMKWNIRRLVMGLVIMNIPPQPQEWVDTDEFLVVSVVLEGLISINLVKDPAHQNEGYGNEYYRAGPYTSGGRKPIEGEWRFVNRQVPPVRYKDFDVEPNKWYWYRARVIAEFGDVQNWWEAQVQFV